MKNAIITVKGFQYVDGDESVIELKTVGKYGEKNSKQYIVYEETDEAGGKTDTLIKISEKETIMQRSGAVETRMVVECGKRHSSLYRTPTGNFVLDVYGECIENSLCEAGGTLTLVYTLNMNNTPVGKNRIEITVKEV
jgi:uncharacterized beta-barrel protein YwiB (DUF1934 family)